MMFFAWFVQIFRWEGSFPLSYFANQLIEQANLHSKSVELNREEPSALCYWGFTTSILM